jgi:hypothetical protein
MKMDVMIMCHLFLVGGRMLDGRMSDETIRGF